MKKIHASEIWSLAKKTSYKKFIECCAQIIKGFIPECLENLEKNLYLSEIKENLSQSQFNSIWLFCQWIAETYNHSGHLHKTAIGIDVEWNKQIVMDEYWKGLMKVNFNKEHLKDLLKEEVSIIADAIIAHLITNGFEFFYGKRPVEFPSWQTFMNEIDKKQFNK